MKKLEDIKGIGPRTIKLLNKIGINNSYDLIHYYPFRYDDIKRSNIDSLEQDDKIIIDGVIETIPTLFHFKKNLDKMSFKLNIGSKLLNVSIFNRGFLKSKLNIGTTITIIGKFDKKHNLVVASEIRFGLLKNEIIEPVYHITYGLTGKQLNNLINNFLDDLDCIDYLPDYIKEKYNFYDVNKCIYNVHKPNDINELKKSIGRLKYEELFYFMLKMNYLKMNKNNKIGLKRNVDFNKVQELIDSLPFKLTIDQNKAVKDIYNDLISEKRMNRLLQGDVGSGKTIVSFISMFINYLSGYQSALMAPTEILAIQHYNNIKNIFKNYDIKIELLTGKLKVSEKKKIYKKLEDGEVDIIIGTHALISEDVKYNNLGLVITDEQHRFGVNQRGNLKNKGITPDILYMSATPIPRTYALTLYGDMEVSNIKSMPSGRKEIKTILKLEKDIKDVLEIMYQELKLNHQVYVIAPLIESSDKIDLKNIDEIKENLEKAFGKLYNIGVLHGKMENKEKDEIMDKFKNNEIQILISTTVIEVGVDVKNATCMVIFDSFRFGLSQLHQLRGRVGRNDLQSYCILVTNRDTERLNILVSTNDGFKISEEDFLLRGSGELFGYKQSGDMNFSIADLKKDYKILLKAKEDSSIFLEKYFDLEKYKYIKNIIVNNMDLD